jgi:hypothetical protein
MKSMLDPQNIIALRMMRQYFVKNANESQYEELFRDMSPVPTVYWCCPGDPPSMYFRAGFDDFKYNNLRRAKRNIIKGRFQHGAIAYIEQGELALFATLYRKPIKQFTHIQEELIELFEREGPMNIKLIKEITGLLVKEITPALHKLQEAFIVFEDQVDNEGDRGWHLYKSEFPDFNLHRYSKTEALKIVLLRFAKLNILFNEENVKSFYKLPMKEINFAINELESSNELVRYKNNYMLRSDYELLHSNSFENLKSVFVLHRNDYLVKSNEHWLKEKFNSIEFKVLQYILMDGEFRGAVIGNFKNGPFILEDIIFDLPKDDIVSRKNEIMKAVYLVNDQKYSPLKKYNGEDIESSQHY